MFRSIYHYRLNWLPDPDLVQHVSLPLELIGFALAWIEIFRPGHSVFLEARIDRAQDWFWNNKYMVLFQPHLEKFKVVPKPRWLHVPFHILGYVLLIWWPYYEYQKVIQWNLSWWIIVPLPFLFLLYIRISQNKNMFIKAISMVLIVVYITPAFVLMLVAYLVLLGAGTVVAFFNSIGGGKAIGGIGFFLGWIGLSGEVYQVLMLDDDEITKFEYWSMVAVLIVLLYGLIRFISRVLKYQSSYS